MSFNTLPIDESQITKTTTTIPVAVRDYINSKGYRVNELIRLGIMAREDNPQMIERIRFLEEKHRIIERKLDDVLIELGRIRDKLLRES